MMKSKLKALQSRLSTSMLQELNSSRSNCKQSDNKDSKLFQIQSAKTLKLYTMKENRRNPAQTIKCVCPANHVIAQIISTYSDKLDRVRQERNSYRQRAKQLKHQKQNLITNISDGSFNHSKQLKASAPPVPESQIQSRLSLKIRYLEEQLKLQKQLNQRFKVQRKTQAPEKRNSFESCQRKQLINQNQFLKQVNFQYQKKIKLLQQALLQNLDGSSSEHRPSNLQQGKATAEQPFRNCKKQR